MTYYNTNLGRKPAKPIGTLGASIAAVVLVVGVVGAWKITTRDGPKQPNIANSGEGWVRPWLTTETAIRARSDFIVEAKRIGAIDRINETGTVVWIGPAFYALDFNTKRNLVSSVFAQYASSEFDGVRIRDNTSGKTIYKYDLISGLR